MNWRPGSDDSPKIIEETRQYIRDFDRVAGMTTTARELYDKMLELYPDRVKSGRALAFGARGQTVKWCERKEFSNAAVATRSSRRTLRCH